MACPEGFEPRVTHRG